jgi:ribosome silencing factor RsfS/YbeB/iojap
MSPRSQQRPPARAALVKLVRESLDDMKAVNVKFLDVRDVTDVADCMVVASGNSDRHVRSIAERVVQRAKQAGYQPFGVEGERDSEWVLVDLNDVIVHVMLPRVREFYGLEGLWEAAPKVAKATTRPAKKSAPRRKPAAGAPARSRKPVPRTGKAAPRADRPAPARKSATAAPARKSATAAPPRRKSPARKAAKRVDRG